MARAEHTGSTDKRQPVVTLAARTFKDARIRTIVFAYLFAVYALIQPVGFRHAYPHLVDRVAFARSFGDNLGLRLFYGQPHNIATVSGYTAWRVGGTLAIVAAVFGLLAPVRALRAEEDAGRTELLLAGVVTRRSLDMAAATAIAAGIVALWLAELAGFALAGLPWGGSAYLALATVSVAPVCVGIGAVASQLAPTRRTALQLGGAIVALFFLFRVVADTADGVGGLRWATPLGWAEELRPFAGAQPIVLLLPLGATLILLGASGRLAAGRDIGTGLVPTRDSADPQLRLLSSPTAQALRTTRGALLTWIGSVGVFGFVLGTISSSLSSADIPANAQRQIAKLGAGSIVTPTGYLAFVFIIVVFAVSLFVCAQVGTLGQEETEHRLETLFALPVDRRRWLAGRLVLAALAAAAVSATAGVCSWAGAFAAGADVSFPRLLEAGVNALPTALLFLGLAALLYSVTPRLSAGVAYGLVALAFLWQLVGALLGAPHWLLDLTPFAHVGLVPAQRFHAEAAGVLVAIGAATASVAIAAFARRDLSGD
jgi:ABC-2 type transport system permease protein